jgi:hypothetical protein
MDFIDSYEWKEINLILEEIRKFADAKASLVCDNNSFVVFCQGESDLIADNFFENASEFLSLAEKSRLALGCVAVRHSTLGCDYYAIPYTGTLFVVLGIHNPEAEELFDMIQRKVNLLALALSDLFRKIEEQRGSEGGSSRTPVEGNSSPMYPTD